MRWTLFVLILFLLLTGCSYSARALIAVHGDQAAVQSQLDAVVKELRGHRDGCFSERLATMLVTETGQGKTYRISNTMSTMDLYLYVDEQGGSLHLELNEWSEKRFSPYVTGCYQELIKRLSRRFSQESLSIKEICEAGSCR